MAEKKVTRKLAAILAADMVGYSRLMEKDEEGTIARQKAHRDELIDPKFAEHGGRIVKSTGDGLLVEFASAVDAVRCAAEVQRAMVERESGVPEDRRIAYRVGINIGDIVIDGDDILGDGVNIAARLEAMAGPGGVCVSGTVHEHVAGKLDLAFDDMGEQQVKNIERPVRVYRVQLDARCDAESISPAPSAQASTRPSMAVLPFQVMDGLPESSLLAQGIAEDLTTAMSHFPWLSVPARHLAFAYDGAALDLRQVGRNLDVRYVLEGSLRQSAGHLRTNAQLIDASTGNHLWARRYDLSREDVFELQDEIVNQIATALGTEIMLAETARARAKSPGELDAWDYYLLAAEQYHAITPEGEAKARQFLHRCIALEPDFVMAYALLAACHANRAKRRWSLPASAAWNEAEKVAEHAIKLDRTHPDANGVLSLVYMTRGMAKDGVAAARRALEANPYDVGARAHLVWALAFAGEPEEALQVLELVLWGSPRSPWFASIFMAAAFANLCLKNFEEALRWGEKAIEQDPGRNYGAYVIQAASLGHLGRVEEANRAIQQVLRMVPSFSLKQVRKNPMYNRSVDAERLIEGLRLAGLPE